MYDPTKPYKHEILKLIRGTWDTPYVRVRSGVYPIITKKFKGNEVQHTDGIGTKGIYHWKKRTFKNAVIDAFAMNANDLAMAGAVPYALLDHITVPEAGERAVLELVRAFTALCRKHKIAIVGGETSHQDTSGFDISISMSGFVSKSRTNRFRVRDVLIGLRSNGLHSNGFTLVRKVFKNQRRADFVRPTAVYLDTVLKLLKKHEIHGMMHITGGAFTKLKDLLKGADAVIEVPKKLEPQSIFHELYKRGVSDKQMYTTFNCGIGFVLSVSEREARKIVSKVPGAAIIGRVVRGDGKICIRSVFSDRVVVL